MKKKALELSMTFLVGLIISIFIFGGSIYFMKQFFSKAEETRIQINEQTKEQIKGLLMGGQIIAVYPSTAHIRAGERAVFGIGIRNIQKEKTDFYLTAGFSDAFDQGQNPIKGSDGRDIDPAEADTWVNYDEGPYLIKAQDSTEVGVLVIPQTRKSGYYVYNVCVTTSPVIGQTNCEGEGKKNCKRKCGEITTANLGSTGLYTGKVYKVIVEIV